MPRRAELLFVPGYESSCDFWDGCYILPNLWDSYARSSTMLKPAFLFTRALVVLLPLALLPGCGGGDSVRAAYPEKDKSDSSPRMNDSKTDSLFNFYGAFDGKKKPADPAGVSVNAFLWRAALDTVSFMPIATADPFGGTIITDWYQLPEGPAQRYKLNVYILDKALRSDGVRVSVFKQTKDASGQWVDAKIDGKMGADIENSILTRARQLRIASTTSP